MQRHFSTAFVFGLALVLCCCACPSEECNQCELTPCSMQQGGPAAISMTLLGRADVMVDGRRIGSVRTLQGAHEGGTTVTSVLDVRGDIVGFVTADGTAYRAAASTRKRIGQGNDLRELAGLILGATQRATLSAVHGKLVPGFPGHSL